MKGGERRERERERRDILRRDSRNSYSCLTTTRHSIMQRFALVRGDARAVGNARAFLPASKDSNGEPESPTLARIAREDGSIIQRTREEIELCLASLLRSKLPPTPPPPARQAHFSSFSSLFG